MTTPTLLEMLKAGAHFGHQVSRWHPKMKPFIYTERNGVHIIDLQQTQKQIEEVLPKVTAMAADGKQILFVSTKPQAREIVKAAAISCGMPYLVDRWIGGALTNFQEIKKLIKQYNELKAKQDAGELEHYTKKERVVIQKKLEKMGAYMEGLTGLTRMPDAVFMPAVQREKTARVETAKTKTPIIGICDTNSNPLEVEHVICANDDAVKSIELMVNLVAGAIKEGVSQYEKKKANIATSGAAESKK